MAAELSNALQHCLLGGKSGEGLFSPYSEDYAFPFMLLHLFNIAVELLALLFSPSGAGIDLSSLIVVEGKICWDLYIDGLVVSSDGNLLDALGAAIKVQLKKRTITRNARNNDNDGFLTKIITISEIILL